MDEARKLKPEDVFINENSTILQALEQLDLVGTQILFIVHNKVLKGCLTDGDVRKAILAGKGLQTKILHVCNYNPVFLFEKEHLKAKELIKEMNLQAVPVVNEKKEIITIVFRNLHCKLNVYQKMDLPVVMMAGGIGTRLYPYTKVLPKPLLPIADIPISERIIMNFREYGCNTFYMIVNYKKEMIKAYYNDLDKEYNLYFIDEKMPLGTGGGLKLMEDQLHKTFVLTNCDILIRDDISKAYEYHKKENNVATIICSLKNFKIPYGVVNFGNKGQVVEMSEKPNMSFFVNTGCYILEPEVLNYIPKNTEIGMPQILENIKDKCGRIGVYPISESSWMDMGQLDTFKTMTDKFESEI